MFKENRITKAAPFGILFLIVIMLLTQTATARTISGSPSVSSPLEDYVLSTFDGNIETIDSILRIMNGGEDLSLVVPNDNFDGNALDTTKWSEQNANGTISQNGSLIATTNGDYRTSIARVSTAYEFPGDFDIQVDYAIGEGWANPMQDFEENGHLDGAVLGIDAISDWIHITRHRSDFYDPPANELMVFSPDCGWCSFVEFNNDIFAAISGKYRIVRSGSTFSFYYDDGGGWSNLYSETFSVSFVRAYIYAGSISTKFPFTAYFDNFIVNSAELYGNTRIAEHDFGQRVSLNTLYVDADLPVGTSIEANLYKMDINDSDWSFVGTYTFDSSTTSIKLPSGIFARKVKYGTDSNGIRLFGAPDESPILHNITLSVAHADSIITVNSLADAITVDSNCTLREAIQNANNNAATNPDCTTGSGADTITFSVSGAIMLGSTLPEIDDTAGLTIDGTGQMVTISGNHAVRVMEVGAASLTLHNLTIADGKASDWGGGINNNSGGTLTVTNSTFSGNSAPYSGAIFNGATLIIANSTFTGNNADNNGGSIGNKNATMTITNSTIFGNSAATNGGIASEGSGTATLRNTIVANNTGGNCSAGTITNGGNNLDSGITCGWGSANGSMSNTNPLLGALTGSPAYFPLNFGSPAIDAGDDAVCAAAPVNNESQNGVTRPQGAHCDIGAFEYIAPTILSLTLKSSGAQDGWILESTEISNVGGTLDKTAATFRLGDDVAKKQYRAILSFSTGATLQDNAVITSVTLKVKKQNIVGGGNPVTIFQGFMLDIKKGTFGTAALQISDFQTAASKTYGPFKPALSGGWYSLDLTSGKAYINKMSTLSGLTQIRLRFSLDDNNNAVANYLSLFSGNAPVASRPQLIIEYYVP